MFATNDISTSNAVALELKEIRKLVQTCIQCGTCTGSCPSAFAMDHSPRYMWRMVIRGKSKELFDSKTFEYCSSCYSCTVRCPRGLPLTEAMHSLKQVASRQSLPKQKKNRLFYKNMVNNIRQRGRINEMEMMTLFFLSMKNPFLPIKFAPLGLKLMLKGKISFSVKSKHDVSLVKLFHKVKEIEGQV